ncbi:MAG: glycosyltransferase family A protein [Candidatus Eisenbacteria bacterium]
MPLVSILVPVRNASPWLGASLASLARQTLADHEVVLVDDGSTDGSGRLLDEAAERDARLVVRHTPARGLPAALNLALSLARAPWIARHDADDLSHRHRLATQLAELERQPALDVLGTAVRLFPATACGVGMRRWIAWHNTLLTHEQITSELLIDSSLTHGTAMFRRATLEQAGGWQERGWAEDLDLWVRLAAQGARFGKLARVLYGWRQHPGSSTRTDSRYSHENFLDLKVSALDSGLLNGGRRVSLVGVGRSLERWRRALGQRVGACHESRRPGDLPVPELQVPVVLALMSPVARDRWRRHLTEGGLRESADFIFVA